MSSIFPDIGSGGVVVRDDERNCTNPANVTNAYCPPSTFGTTCGLTALPNNCIAQITPAQINALSSELLCLAVKLSPNGEWNCNNTCNLSAMFSSWSDNNKVVDGVTITGDGTPASPWTASGTGLVGAVCASLDAREALAACLISSDANNQLEAGSDGLMFVLPRVSVESTTLSGDGSPTAPIGIRPAGIASGICGNATAKLTLANCMRSAAAGQLITVGPDNGLYLTAAQIATGLCASDTAGDTLASCLRSTQAGNLLTLGTDGRLFYALNGAAIASALCSDPAGDTLASCLRSVQSGNALGLGTDGRLYVTPSGTPTVLTDGTMVTGNGAPGSAITLNVPNVATAICASNSAVLTLRACLVSSIAASSACDVPSAFLVKNSAGNLSLQAASALRGYAQAGTSSPASNSFDLNSQPNDTVVYPGNAISCVNPSNCYSMVFTARATYRLDVRLIGDGEFYVDFVFQGPGGSAAVSVARFARSGAGSEDTTRPTYLTLTQDFVVAPSGSTNYLWNVRFFVTGGRFAPGSTMTILPSFSTTGLTLGHP